MDWTEAHAYWTAISRTIPTAQITLLVCAATFGVSKCIHLTAEIALQMTSFIADTGSLVSIIKQTLVNTGYATSTITNFKTVNGDCIKVHRKMTLPITLPCLRLNYISTIHVNDNILGLDLLTKKTKTKTSIAAT